MQRAPLWIAWLLVVGSALHFFGGNVADPDLWGHLRYGTTILEEGGLPWVDEYSYTAPGAPFYDHEWLSDLLFAALYGAAGPAGLIIAKLLVGGAILLLLVCTARMLWQALEAQAPSIHPLTVGLTLVLVVAVIHPGATFRPQLFTMLFLAAEQLLLTRADRRLSHAGGRRISWELAAIPPLLGLWANLHGGFMVGLGLFGLYGGAVFLRSLTPRLPPWSAAPVTPREAAWVAALCLAGAVAPLINPYGVELYTYLFRTLDMHGEISEWFPVELLSTQFFRFKLLVLTTALATVWLVRQWREKPAVVRLLAWHVPFLAFAAFYAFRHQRHSVLFAIAAAPLLLVAVEQMRRSAERRWPALIGRPPVRAVLAAGITAVAVFQIASWGAQIRKHGMSIPYGRLDYPVDAVEFMRTHGIEGNVAMPFEWGAYAIWKLAPRSRVFIDGRFEAVYPPRVIDDYFTFMHGRPGWERLIEDYPTDVIVVQRWRELHHRLFERDDLANVYSDPASLIFVRKSAKMRDALERLARLPNRHDFPRLATYFP